MSDELEIVHEESVRVCAELGLLVLENEELRFLVQFALQCVLQRVLQRVL